MTSRAGPLGALSVAPATSTTNIKDDIDGELLWGVAGGFGSVHHRVLKTTGLDPILCPNILQNRAWEAVIIPMGLVPEAADLRYLKQDPPMIGLRNLY
jgi:hypothetical protein